ncbi:MAG: TIGR01459 family HAD-type hydrolase, partial [Rickettsiales bacterium]
RIIFLSNAPRRAKAVEDKLNDLGITPDLYDHVLSSGEIGRRFLAEPDSLSSNHKYFYLGPEKDADLLDGLHFERTEDMADAAFILDVDVEFHGQEVQALEPYLNEARRHNLPMVCVNPDIEVVKQSGQRIWCAGAIAGHYEKMGGEVSYFGKPFPAVYDAVKALLDDVKQDCILAVGDNLDTDIAGALEAGIDCALVTGGILASEFGPRPDPYALRELCERKNALPNYVIPALTWQHQAA